MQKKILTFLCVFFIFKSYSQKKLSFQDVLLLAKKNNTSLKAAKIKVDEKRTLTKTAFILDKTEVYFSFDENNLATNNIPLNVFGISQEFKFPTFYTANKKVKQTELALEEINYNKIELQVKQNVFKAYYELIYTKNKVRIYKFLDSLYQNSTKQENLKKQFSYLDLLNLKSKQRELNLLYKEAQNDVFLKLENLKNVIHENNLVVVNEPLRKLDLKEKSIDNHIDILYYKTLQLLQNETFKRQKQEWLPDFSLEYFQGTNNQLSNTIRGYQIGLKFPLLFSKNSVKSEAFKLASYRLSFKEKEMRFKLENKIKRLKKELLKYKEAIYYYTQEGETLKNEIFAIASKEYINKHIDFLSYFQNIETALNIELEYLKNLNLYNQIVILLHHQVYSID